MWTPDVYEGSPSPVTAFFSSAPKVAAAALFARLLHEPFVGVEAEWRQILVFLAVASMFVGAVGAIGQTNIKRLMAYSSIGHMGYALVGLAAGGEEGVSSLLVYLTIYLVMNLGVFAFIVAMTRGGAGQVRIADLAGLSRTQPVAALCLAMLMFSLAGRAAASRILRQVVRLPGGGERRPRAAGDRRGGGERDRGFLLPAHRADPLCR